SYIVQPSTNILTILHGQLFNILFTSPHSMEYVYIAASGDTDFPESTVVGFLDDHQFVYFDSNNKTLVPTTEWMKENAGEYYWELYKCTYKHAHTLITVHRQLYHYFFPSSLSGGHTIQNLHGCEWNVLKDYFHHYGYDGEDFILLDMNNMSWIKWNNNTNDLQYLKFGTSLRSVLYVNLASGTLTRIGTDRQ
uniref:MHC class I-like antigen recognition-like domain-containing protein n=1 Tax=Hucho hucho TaxID=62062 RepID=A0A4W5NZI0_9TELE